jgi:hypothetical protein
LVAALASSLMAAGVAALAGYAPVDFEAVAPVNEGQAELAFLATDLTLPFGRRRSDVVAWMARVYRTEPANRAAVVDAAARAIEARLSRTPTDGYAWLALAEFRLIRDGYGAGVERALGMSHYAAPVEQYVMLRRARFSLAIWRPLSEDLRRQARIDLQGLAPWHGPDIVETLAREAYVDGPDQLAAAREEIARVSPFSAAFFDQVVARERAKGAR